MVLQMFFRYIDKLYLFHYNIHMKSEDQFLNSLVDLGLKEQEAKVYLACLKLGQSVVSQISEEANIQRTFAYDILVSLYKQGMVSLVEVNGKKNYSAVSIEQFKNIQLEKYKKFEALIPELKSLEKTTGNRPKVRFFEGIEGIQDALEDTLDQPDGSEILAYATAEGYYASDTRYTNSYIKRRTQKKIFSKCIAPDNQTNREFALQDKEHNRQTLLVPYQMFPFSNEIDIYGNKVAIMSLQEELLAIIIESESVANTQRAIFELAWLGAKHLQ